MKVFSFYVVSDTTNMAYGPDVPDWSNAVYVYADDPAWTASIPGARWIWDAEKVSDPSIEQSVNFTNSFYIPGPPVYGSLELACG